MLSSILSHVDEEFIACLSPCRKEKVKNCGWTQ